MALRDELGWSMRTVSDIDAQPVQQTDAVTAQATGVLVLAQRVAPDAAHAGLLAAAHRYGVAVEALAAAVVARAGGLTIGDAWLGRAVRVEWGDLLD
jgi:hypothetical protein